MSSALLIAFLLSAEPAGIPVYLPDGRLLVVPNRAGSTAGLSAEDAIALPLREFSNARPNEPEVLTVFTKPIRNASHLGEFEPSQADVERRNQANQLVADVISMVAPAPSGKFLQGIEAVEGFLDGFTADEPPEPLGFEVFPKAKLTAPSGAEWAGWSAKQAIKLSYHEIHPATEPNRRRELERQQQANALKMERHIIGLARQEFDAYGDIQRVRERVQLERQVEADRQQRDRMLAFEQKLAQIAHDRTEKEVQAREIQRIAESNRQMERDRQQSETARAFEQRLARIAHEEKVMQTLARDMQRIVESSRQMERDRQQRDTSRAFEQKLDEIAREQSAKETLIRDIQHAGDQKRDRELRESTPRSSGSGRLDSPSERHSGGHMIK